MPILSRLCKQLQIDFASDTHGQDGEKRKREPTRSIYEEAAANFEKDEAERAQKKKSRKRAMKKGQHKAARRWMAKKTTPIAKALPAAHSADASAEISEIDEGERSSFPYNPEEQHAIMLHAAASLAQLGRQNTLRMEEEVAATREKAATVKQRAPMKAMLVKAHTDALLAAKDDTLRATTAALMAKEELVKLQATLIAMMQQQRCHGAADQSN